MDKKTYISPLAKREEIDTNDVITTSPGTEMPPISGGEGIWDQNIGSDE